MLNAVLILSRSGDNPLGVVGAMVHDPNPNPGDPKLYFVGHPKLPSDHPMVLEWSRNAAQAAGEDREPLDVLGFLSERGNGISWDSSPIMYAADNEHVRDQMAGLTPAK